MTLLRAAASPDLKDSSKKDLPKKDLPKKGLPQKKTCPKDELFRSKGASSGSFEGIGRSSNDHRRVGDEDHLVRCKNAACILRAKPRFLVNKEDRKSVV